MRKLLSGYFRLGIVLSIAWLLIFPGIYFLGLKIFPLTLGDAMAGLYTWVYPSPRTWGRPTINWFVLISYSILPVLVPWLLLFVIPSSIRWVRAGFARTQK